MPESPFEHTTLRQSAGPYAASGVPANSEAISEASGESREVRYPAATRTLVPAATVLSGLVAPLIVYFALPAPLNLVLALVVGLMDLATAAFLWFLFNAAFVRADETGLTKSQLNQITSIGWEEIAGVEIEERAGTPQRTYALKNESGETVFTFGDFGNREDGEKLRHFIAARLEAR